MATTIADALTLLANNKAAIKQAIIDKGVSVSDNDALSTYASKIESISGGSIEDLITKENLVQIIINIGGTDFTLDASNNFSDTNDTFVESKGVQYIKFYFADLEIDIVPIGNPTSPTSNKTYNFLVVGSRIFGLRRDSANYYIYLNNVRIGLVMYNN